MFRKFCFATNRRKLSVELYHCWDELYNGKTKPLCPIDISDVSSYDIYRIHQLISVMNNEIQTQDFTTKTVERLIFEFLTNNITWLFMPFVDISIFNRALFALNLSNKTETTKMFSIIRRTFQDCYDRLPDIAKNEYDINNSETIEKEIKDKIKWLTRDTNALIDEIAPTAVNAAMGSYVITANRIGMSVAPSDYAYLLEALMFSIVRKLALEPSSVFEKDDTSILFNGCMILRYYRQFLNRNTSLPPAKACELTAPIVERIRLELKYLKTKQR